MIHIFSQSKSNQTMKFGQLIKYNKIIILLQNYAENEAERLVPGLFLFSKNFICGKSKCSTSLILLYFNSPQFGNKNKLYKNKNNKKIKTNYIKL